MKHTVNSSGETITSACALKCDELQHVCFSFFPCSFISWFLGPSAPSWCSSASARHLTHFFFFFSLRHLRPSASHAGSHSLFIDVTQTGLHESITRKKSIRSSKRRQKTLFCFFFIFYIIVLFFISVSHFTFRSLLLWLQVLVTVVNTVVESLCLNSFFRVTSPFEAGGARLGRKKKKWRHAVLCLRGGGVKTRPPWLRLFFFSFLYTRTQTLKGSGVMGGGGGRWVMKERRADKRKRQRGAQRQMSSRGVDLIFNHAGGESARPTLRSTLISEVGWKFNIRGSQKMNLNETSELVWFDLVIRHLQAESEASRGDAALILAGDWMITL